MNASRKQTDETTKKIKGIGAEVRVGGWTYRVTLSHLGNNGYKYERFCGEWQVVMRTSIPAAARRELAAKIKVAIDQSLGRGAWAN